MRTYRLLISLGVVSLLIPSPSLAKKKAKGDDMQAQMMKAMEAQKPGAEHAVLNPLAGNWTYTSKHWMKPDGKPEESTGTSTFAWILDGRFVRQDFKGTMMGKPFEGLGFIGYDMVRKEYVSIWLDSMGTGVVKGTAQFDAATRTLKETGQFSCPMTGQKDMTYRSEWKMIDNDHHSYTMFMKDPTSGQEGKSMEIMYTRAK